MTPHPVNGWHWREWLAEAAGTGLLMFTAVSGWYWCVAAGQPWSSFAVRVPILSVLIGLVVIALAYSPIGRRSGAHFNPALTFGLFLQRAVSPADLAGYIAAQVLGGTAGFALGRVWGHRVAEAGVRWAQIAPSPALPQGIAALIEAAATTVQLATMFLMLKNAQSARWVAVAAAVLLAAGIYTLAGVTGAGFSPVRGVVPDVLARDFPGAWIYLVGPLAGALLAALAARLGPQLKTAKLHHDPTRPCYLRCELSHAPTRRR